MADTLNQTLVTDFTDMINHLAQQKSSYMRGRVIEKPVTGKKFDYQNLGAFNDNSQTSRFEKVSPVAANHTRRGAIVKTFNLPVLVDGQDELQSLVNLESGYAEGIAAAMARRFDQVAVEAALSSTLTGEDLTTETAFAGTTVSAGGSLTYENHRDILAAFYAKGLGLEADEQLYLAISDKEHSSLLNEIEVISQDYRRNEFAVDSGRVTNILGMNVIVFPSAPDNGTEILNVSGGTRDCFAFSSKGICVGVNSDIEIRVDDRPDLVDAKQVKALFRLGALRTEDAKVVKVTSTDV